MSVHQIFADFFTPGASAPFGSVIGIVSAALAGVGDGAAGAAQPKKRGRPRKVQPDGPASAATKPAN